jgi:hypothetical protein
MLHTAILADGQASASFGQLGRTPLFRLTGFQALGGRFMGIGHRSMARRIFFALGVAVLGHRSPTGHTQGPNQDSHFLAHAIHLEVNNSATSAR